jgi:hypothetical protein
MNEDQARALLDIADGLVNMAAEHGDSSPIAALALAAAEQLRLSVALDRRLTALEQAIGQSRAEVSS